MGRVTRLMERRVLRRAADQALMTPAYLRTLDMASGTPSATPPVDTREDADHADPWGENSHTTGHEPADPITEPIAAAALHERLHDTPVAPEFDDAPATRPAAKRAVSAPIGSWKPDLIERRRVRARPWYRSRVAVAALAAAALAAVVASAVSLVAGGGEQATSVTPQASTTAGPRPSSQPAPSLAPPTLSNTPPAPPPPPASSASTADPAPVWRNNDSWSPDPPSPTKKPEIGVTRAPFSAVPPKPPEPNSPTPDGHPKRRRGLFG